MDLLNVPLLFFVLGYIHGKTLDMDLLNVPLVSSFWVPGSLNLIPLLNLILLTLCFFR